MKKILFVILVISSSFLFAQVNLVPNPNFQILTKKVKSEGQIKMAAPWVSPTLSNADLYVAKTKNDLISIPKNAYGEEDPMKGDNYAGFLAYSYKNKEPRSYLQTELTEKLKEGEEYCVTVNISLADLSKYASDNVGIYISNQAISANNSEIMPFDPQIVSITKKIYDKQYYWTPVCGVYKAQGGEKFITIGNFKPDEETQVKKLKKPRGFTVPQLSDSYYYIDNVSVVLASESKKCMCEDVGEEVEVVSRSFSSETTKDEVKGSKTIVDGIVSVNSIDELDGLVIDFDHKSHSIVGVAANQLDRVVLFMRNHPDVVISIATYSDSSEKDTPNLANERWSTIYKYLQSKRLRKERIQRATMDTVEGNKRTAEIRVSK